MTGELTLMGKADPNIPLFTKRYGNTNAQGKIILILYYKNLLQYTMICGAI